MKKERFWKNVIATPFVWMMLPPILFADIVLELYHHICFPLYGKPLVERRAYIKIFDRTRLQHLSFLKKIACAYCGYANGWFRYAGAIAAETERYWCAIQHEKDARYIPGAHEKDFAPFE